MGPLPYQQAAVHQLSHAVCTTTLPPDSPDRESQLKGVSLPVEATFKRHQSIVDWHLREDRQRKMRRDIKRELWEAGMMSEC